MRHEQIADKASYAKVEIAAAWPVIARVAPAPLPEDAEAVGEAFVVTPSCPDVPAAAGGLIVGAYVGLIATFAIAMTGSAQSVFAIAICGVFLAAFFAVPRIFLGLEQSGGPRPSFERFLREGMATLTGRARRTWRWSRSGSRRLEAGAVRRSPPKASRGVITAPVIPVTLNRPVIVQTVAVSIFGFGWGCDILAHVRARLGRESRDDLDRLRAAHPRPDRRARRSDRL